MKALQNSETDLRPTRRSVIAGLAAGGLALTGAGAMAATARRDLKPVMFTVSKRPSDISTEADLSILEEMLYVRATARAEEDYGLLPSGEQKLRSYRREVCDTLAHIGKGEWVTATGGLSVSAAAFAALIGGTVIAACIPDKAEGNSGPRR